MPDHPLHHLLTTESARLTDHATTLERLAVDLADIPDVAPWFAPTMTTLAAHCRTAATHLTTAARIPP